MKAETIEKKCGFLGMYCILGSIAISFLIAISAVVAMVVWVFSCLL